MSQTRKVTLNEIEAHFQKQNLVSLATAEGDQPRVRIVSLIRINGGFYVITGARGGAQTAKVRQIKQNPKVEFVMRVERDGQIGNIRAAGTASIMEDHALKTRLFEEIEWVGGYFRSPEDMKYVLLQIDVKSYEYSVPGRPEVIKIEAL